VALRRGESWRLAATGPVALAVTAGVLTLAADQSQLWLEHMSGEDEWIAPGEEAALLPGDGVLCQAGIVGALRNDGGGPLLLDLLTISPAAGIVPTATPIAAEISVPKVPAAACGISCWPMTPSVPGSPIVVSRALLDRPSRSEGSGQAEGARFSRGH
jgi:hypothetical protein